MIEKWIITISGLEPNGPEGNTTSKSAISSAVYEMIEQAAYHSNLNGYGDDFKVYVDIEKQ